MSRLSLLAAAVLSLTAAASSAPAVIVFYPAPVPTPNCTCSPSNLSPYYQRQLYVLNHPYGSINLSNDNPCARPTVDLLQQPCQEPEAPRYYRKADLMPHPAAERPEAAAPTTTKGVILIIPKALLNRSLKSLHSQPAGRLALRD